MSEEKENEQPVDNSDEGSESKVDLTIDRANEAAQRMDDSREQMREENDRRNEIISREENLHARKRLEGNLEAGHKEKKVEETPKEYADRILSGNVE